MPWLRWFAMYLAVFVVILIFNETTVLTLKVGVFIAFVFIFVTYYPIKQRFVLDDGQALAICDCKGKYFWNRLHFHK